MSRLSGLFMRLCKRPDVAALFVPCARALSQSGGHKGRPYGIYYCFFAPASSGAALIQLMIRSAICRLFLSIISMWLLPLMPSAGR